MPFIIFEIGIFVMQQQVRNEKSAVNLLPDRVHSILFVMVAGPGHHIQKKRSVFFQEFFESSHENLQPVDAHQTGTKIGFHRFKKRHIVPAPQLIR